MTLRELTAELDKVSLELQKLRRADYEIPGNVAFVAAMRQHIVLGLTDVRDEIDGLVMSLDHVDDVDKLMSIRERIAGKLTERMNKMLGAGGE